MLNVKDYNMGGWGEAEFGGAFLNLLFAWLVVVGFVFFFFNEAFKNLIKYSKVSLQLN